MNKIEVEQNGVLRDTKLGENVPHCYFVKQKALIKRGRTQKF